MRKENERRHGGKDGRQALKKSRDRQFGDRRASSNKKYPVVQGTVSMTREGYAFVEVPEEPDNDVFVKASKTRGALNGDIVKVAVTREKPAGKAGIPRARGVRERLSRLWSAAKSLSWEYCTPSGRRRGC